MAELVAARKTAALGGRHRLLDLFLNEDDYIKSTRDLSATINMLPITALVRKAITASSTPLKILTHQESHKVKKAAYKL